MDEGCVTPYAFAKLVGVQPQVIYGLCKREETFPSWRTDQGQIAIPRAIALEWWQEKHPAPTVLTEPVLAFRTFLNTKYGLGSYIQPESYWEPGKPTQAVCMCMNSRRREHSAPGIRCSCGLYGLREFEDVVHSGYVSKKGIIAAVALWGHVITGMRNEEDRGYRAQYGQVVAVLCEDWQEADTIHGVAHRYGVPIAHNRKTFAETNWVATWNTQVGLAETLKGDPSGHWRRGEGDDSSAVAAARGDAGTAACREATKGAGSLGELKYLYREGTISVSNIEELLRG